MKILVINTGSTSTKIAVHDGIKELRGKSIKHHIEELKEFGRIIDQLEYRAAAVKKWLDETGNDIKDITAIAVRGGILRPIQGGTYLVDEDILGDLRSMKEGEHASNLSGLIGAAIAAKYNIPVYTVDPVTVDEFSDIARISGIPEITRRSRLHALNIKAVSRYTAEELNKKVEDLNLIVAHLGGGISIAPVQGGRIIDVNDSNEEGPFSPERSGGLPSSMLAELAFSGKYTFKELKKRLVGNGGIMAYLGTNDMKEVAERVNKGDEKAQLILNAMIYQIAKEIGAMSTVLCGRVDYIVITGGLSNSGKIVEELQKRVAFIAPIIVKQGEDEMKALVEGVFRVLNGQETVKVYSNEVKSGRG